MMDLRIVSTTFRQHIKNREFKILSNESELYSILRKTVR